MESERFTYNAPRFFDFINDSEAEDAKNAEAFFEIDHEYNGVTAGVSVTEPEHELEFFTPLRLTPDDSKARRCNPLRKSISLVDLSTHNEEANGVSGEPVVELSITMTNLKILDTKKSSKSINSTDRRKTHTMNTRGDVPKLNLRSRTISRERIDLLAQPKHKVESLENLSNKKYVSMAEAIREFQLKTPKRFYSKTTNGFATKCDGPLPSTIPQSPALATKQRARPVHILSREEQELKDFEEAKKFKIKANPVNMKILNGPVLPKTIPQDRKVSTIPEPFKLTKPPVKKPLSPEPIANEFRARPVPKTVREPPKPIIKQHLCTVPNTPKLMKRYTHDKHKNETVVDGEIQKGIHQPLKLDITKPVPFSFEKRDKEILKKREKMINEVLEEEKKAREFHARPLPRSIFRSPQAKHVYSFYQKHQKSDDSINKNNQTMSETSMFKARPAKVLYAKPFEPKRGERPLTEISEFQLNTEHRAIKREEYENQKKMREEMLDELIKERQENLIHKEQEDTAKLRKQMEFKAQPIRHYKDAKPVPSKKLTDPISPQFSCRSNKENTSN